MFVIRADRGVAYSLLMPEAEEPSVAGPVALSLVFLVLAIVVPMMRGGFRHGSLLGAALAFAGAVPAAYAAWRGIQSKSTQSRLLGGMVLCLACVGVGGLLIVLRAVHWLR